MPIDRKKFVEALKRVRPAVAANDFLPQLTHFHFEPEDLGAFNGELGIAVPFKTGVNCLVPAARFFDVVESMVQTEINLAVEDLSLVLTAHKHKSKYPLRDPADFPKIRRDKPEDWLAVPDDFSEALEKCLPVVDMSGIRPDLGGVCVAGEDVYASDNKRISWYAMKQPVGDTPILLSTDLVKAVIRMGSPNQMLIDAKSAAFGYADGSQVIGTLVADKFPENMGQYFPTPEKVTTINSAGTKSIRELLERVGNFTQKGSVEARSTLEFFPTGIKAGFTDAVSEIEDSIEDLPFDVGAVKVEVNPFHVAEALKTANQIAVCRPGGESKISLILYFRTEDGKFQHMIALAAEEAPQEESK